MIFSGKYTKRPRDKFVDHLLRFTATLLLSFLLLITGCETNSSKKWEWIYKKIQSDFPTVSHISTENLHNWLNSEGDAKPIILDRREHEEYAVSHLSGAFLATNDEEALGIIQREGKDRPIIVYCAVGYRSAALAKKLQEKGFTNIYNLEGSLFKWANEGREIYQSNQRVNVVHTYNRMWKDFLERRLWYTPQK